MLGRPHPTQIRPPQFLPRVVEQERHHGEAFARAFSQHPVEIFESLPEPEKVLVDLRQEAENYYEALVKAKPGLMVYRAGWLRRAAA